MLDLLAIRAICQRIAARSGCLQRNRVQLFLHKALRLRPCRELYALFAGGDSTFKG